MVRTILKSKIHRAVIQVVGGAAPLSGSGCVWLVGGPPRVGWAGQIASVWRGSLIVRGSAACWWTC